MEADDMTGVTLGSFTRISYGPYRQAHSGETMSNSGKKERGNTEKCLLASPDCQFRARPNVAINTGLIFLNPPGRRPVFLAQATINLNRLISAYLTFVTVSLATSRTRNEPLSLLSPRLYY